MNDEEFKALLNKVYQVVNTLLKVKYFSKNFTLDQIELKSIEYTAQLCKTNKNGTPSILINMNKDLDRTHNIIDFEFQLYVSVKRYLGTYE